MIPLSQCPRTHPNTAWVKRLRAGDAVAVVDRGEVVYRSTVKHITPTGFITVWRPGDRKSSVFYANGYLRDSVYGHRFLVDPTEVDVQGATKP